VFCFFHARVRYDRSPANINDPKVTSYGERDRSLALNGRIDYVNRIALKHRQDNDRSF